VKTKKAPDSIAIALTNFDRLPAAAFVRLPVVVGLFGVTPHTVWRWVKAGRLPQPVKLSPGVTAWRVGDLRSFINNQPKG
jgi:predicted DNA-binding transcriptional regulator AlpA